MKKTLVSLATASLLASGAMAADKGIDIVTTGQAAVYYNTLGNNGSNAQSRTLFTANGGEADSRANYGIQLNLNADLKNDFTFGSTINYLGTLGLEKNAVNDTAANVNGGLGENTIADDIYFAQLFIAKKLGNTTIKLGRQELPKSLSPFAYSEGWNIFKNTFDAALIVNTDIPDTTVVGAYVSKGNGNGFGNNMSSFDDLVVTADAATLPTSGTAYLLTVQNKSIPMTTVTASYYSLAEIGAVAAEAAVASKQIGVDSVTGSPIFDLGTPAVAKVNGIHADALWLDVAIADKSLPMGLKVGVQAGQMNPDSKYAGLDTANTTAYGAKVSLKPVDALTLCLAYSSVDGDDDKVNVAMKNTTGVKTPLYTQMIANQNAIALDSNTYMVKGVYNAGDYGKLIVQGTQTTAGDSSLMTYADGDDTKGSDFLDIEVVYKFKAAGVNFLAAYISQDWDKDKGAAGDDYADHNDIVRVVARYAF